MERYEQISVVGEGSYGLVMKCRHRESDQLVAIKKFLETEDDAAVRKMALREIRMLKKLKHENLVTLLDAFRHRKRFYLVFEFLEGTVLDEIDKSHGGLGHEKTRQRVFQVLRAVAYCHSHHIVHRDIKPENVLISTHGVVKLCDFGFARVMTSAMEPCTDYVATRWYRAPELLVGEQQYGCPIDIWATGCLLVEMLTGEPLFPGESDIDQLFIILKKVGKPCQRHLDLMSKNSQLRGMAKNCAPTDFSGVLATCEGWPEETISFLISCLQMDPTIRSSSSDLLQHSYFNTDNFAHKFLPLLRDKVVLEFNANPLLRKFKTNVLHSTDRARYAHAKKRASQPTSVAEPLKWKMTMHEEHIKRKFKCHHFDATNSHHHIYSHHHEHQLEHAQPHSHAHLSHHHVPLKSYREKTGLTFLKSNKLHDANSFGNPSIISKSHDGVITFKVTTDEAGNTYSLNCHPLPAKKSPLPMRRSIATSNLQKFLAQNVGDIPISSKAYSTSIVPKKVERYSIHDLFINIEPLHLGPTGTLGNNGKKIKAPDEFTLPNLPGASATPKHTKPSNVATSPETTTSNVTPDEASLASSSKDILPTM